MSFPKPSRLDRDVAKWATRVAKAAKRNAEVRAAKATWLKRSKECEQRDGGICRLCGNPTMKPPCDPRFIGAPHHIVYRSAGGSDDLSNLLWMHAVCHNREHAHEIKITGTSDWLIVVVLKEPKP